MSAIAPIWVTARAAGIAALLMASLSASLGLISALKPRWARGRQLELHAGHESLALVTVGLIVVHGLALLADPVLRPGLTGVLVPFAGPYLPVATGLGQIAAYGMAGLGLTFYVRKRIGGARWRAMHRVVAVFWGLAVAHGLLAGTDATQWWFMVALGAPVITAGALLFVRYTEPTGQGTRAGL